MSWNPQYPVNFGPDGDSVAAALGKHINEILEIYSKLKRTRELDSSPTPPPDAWENCLWIDSSDPLKPIIKVFLNGSWQAVFDVLALENSVDSIIQDAEARVDAAIGDLNKQLPAGSITAFCGTAVPDGWFECDGSTYSTSEYPNLYTVLGSDTLPDLRGEFIRGWDHGRGRDFGGASREILSIEDEMLGEHYHLVGEVGNVAGTQYKKGLKEGTVVEGLSGGDLMETCTTSNSYENRPRNVALMYIIKAI